MSLGRVLAIASNQGQIRQQIAVGDHYPFGCVCGTRRVLEKSQAIAVDARVVPLLLNSAVDGISRKETRRLQLRSLREQALYFSEKHCGGEDHRRLRIVGNSAELGKRSARAQRRGGIDRDGNDASIETTKESKYEL